MLSEGSLRVHGVQLSDAGRYYCTVSNQAGSDHRGVDLRVFGKYRKEKVTFSVLSCNMIAVLFTLKSPCWFWLYRILKCYKIRRNSLVWSTSVSFQWVHPLVQVHSM